MSDVFSAAGSILAALIASIALIWSVITYRETASLSHYGELDRMYADLLRLALECPHLRLSPAPQRSADGQAQFDAYAYMVWNLIETVYDRIYDDDSKEKKKLRKTWCMVIREEEIIFGDWFKDNSSKFKDEFKKFIDKKSYLEDC